MNTEKTEQEVDEFSEYISVVLEIFGNSIVQGQEQNTHSVELDQTVQPEKI